MLEDRAVAHLENVLDISVVSTRTGFCKAHVAHTASNLNKVLTGYFSIGLPSNTMIIQEAINFRIIGGLLAKQIYLWLA
jgi:hypothetical protein